MSPAQQVSIVKVFSQEDFDSFASLSGDNNPIHTSPEFCAGTRFGHTVAHGLLLCSVLRGLIETLLPGARLDEQSVMFPAPTYANDPMQFTVNTAEGTGKQIRLDLEVKRIKDGVVTCLGNAGVTI